MYWRKSKIDANNEKILEPYCTFDLYISTDDYLPFIKLDTDCLGPTQYPFCVMKPFGTKYGAEIIARFSHFHEAFAYLKSYIELSEGT